MQGPGIAILVPADLVVLVLESFLYGVLVLLFVSAVHFLTTRRNFARPRAKHRLTSVVFLAVTALFVVETAHWILIVYEAFFGLIHLGNTASEVAFAADFAVPSGVAKIVFLFVAILVGDGIVTYRLWIIWGRNVKVVIFPIVTHIALAVLGLVLIVKMVTWAASQKVDFGEEFTWEAASAVLSLLPNLYSTAFIALRIWKVTDVVFTSESTLPWFLLILIESAALQTFWLLVCAVTAVLKSEELFSIPANTLPAIIAISNTLIHTRVGWSQG
ncbi:hypothetical protein MSAN_01125600 [Mycena sanguinolenta]|uniref:Uncharacterized protein n=1 Tax=Mycena sanguinolenta TaxID=230812 RepID=A0A8H7D4A5_9AGAR|nr:hypothetical protein MSAN_01125600 [Mycena sanguinolenta]